MSVLKHFGKLDDIHMKPDLRGRLDKLEAKIIQFVESEYQSARNSYSQNTYDSNKFGAYINDARSELNHSASKSELVMRGIASIFNEEFKGHTYLKGVKMDESRGRILKSDIIRYINAYFGFLGLFKVYNDEVNYSILESIEIECVDIPVVREFKIKYISDLLNLKSELSIKDYFDNPIFDYVKMDVKIDHSYIMYEMFIDSSKKITYSNFYNSYIMDCFKVKEKYSSYIIYKLSDFEVSMTEYFNNQLKEYMHKEEYEKVISYYVGAFEDEYCVDLYESIKENSIVTKYMMLQAIKKLESGELKSKSNSEKIKDVRLNDVLNDEKSI